MKTVEKVVGKVVKSVFGQPVGNHKCIFKHLKIKLKYLCQKNMRKSFARLLSELDEIEEDVKTKLETDKLEMQKINSSTETWLNEVERMKGDIEDLESDYQNSSQFMCGVCLSPDLLKLHRRAMKITGRIEKLKTQITQIKIKVVKSQTPVPRRLACVEAKNVNLENEVDTKDESNVVEVHLQGKKVLQRKEIPQVKLLESDSSLIIAPQRGEIPEELSDEIVPHAFTKSLSAVDQVSGSSIEFTTEDDMMCPPEPDVIPLHEPEIQLIYPERDGGLSVRAKGKTETVFHGNKGMLPIQEMEFEAVPSQTAGIRTKPGLKKSVRQSAESSVPTKSMEIGSSNRTATEMMTSPFGKENKLPSGDQLLLESGSDANYESIKRTMRKIFRCMNEVAATIIGVHGIGGIGKTTLLKALTGYARAKSSFDVIILVSVTRYWTTRKIQYEVLRQLSLCCEDSETDSQVAEKLSQVLKEKKFLLLLDDVWEHIDLKAVGIPDPSSENGCKILMASRNLDVCRSMDATGVIEVETVSGEEAWKLFHEQVGGIIHLPDIQPFARAIVKGCGGLPLLIIVTGRALAQENNAYVWEHASRKFSLPRTAGVCQIEDVIQLLKFSLDQLKDHDIKSCFLHCALFSEDVEINVFEFIDYCIEEGIISGTTLADAYNRGYDIVDVLVRAALLEVTEDREFIKMHDLIRDLALGILSSEAAEYSQFLLRAYPRLKVLSNPGISSSARSINGPETNRLSVPEGHQFLLRARAGLTEPPSEEEWRQAKMIFLMDNDLRTLPLRPNCHELFILFLQRNCRLRAIPTDFFDMMSSLKVLNLSKTSIKSLPKSLFKLKSLQILILRDCECLAVLPSEVGSLESLEVLDLQDTEIINLPDEIGQLASLRHLQVSFYGSINHTEYAKLPRELITRGILSKLHKLEILSIAVYPGDRRWYKEVKSIIFEVSNLKELSSLCFHFPEEEFLELFLRTSIAWKDQHLSEFKFVVGHDVKSIISRVPNCVKFDYYQHGQCLRFVNSEKKVDAVLEVLARSSAFYLDHHLVIRSLSEFGVININRLKFCILSECPNIETVLDRNKLTETVFPVLENLSIHHLWNLTCLWEGNIPEGSFAELKILTVHACPKLKYVFGSFMIQSMPKLEELTIEDCPAIEEIIMFESEIIDSDLTAFSSLKKLKLHYLPGLVNIWKSAWPSLESISFYNCPRLKKLGMDSRLKHRQVEIKAEESWWNALEWEDPELHLHLQNCFTSICEDDI